MMVVSEALRPTVVIPLYNKREYVARAVASASAQEPRPVEVIVVDDGSTDGGADAVPRDTHVRLVRQSRRGPGGARNRGLREARTDWVAFLDADDEWAPGWMRGVVEAAATWQEAVCVFTNYRTTSSREAGLLTVPDRSGPLVDYFSFVRANEGNGVYSSAVLAKRSALLDCGGFAEGVVCGEDVDAWTRLAWSGPVVFVPGVLALYHTEVPGSLMKGADRLLLPEPLVFRSYRQWKKDGKIPRRLSRSSGRLISRMVADYVLELAIFGRGSDARMLLRSGITHLALWPSDLVRAAGGAVLPTWLLRLWRSRPARHRRPSQRS